MCVFGHNANADVKGCLSHDTESDVVHGIRDNESSISAVDGKLLHSELRRCQRAYGNRWHRNHNHTYTRLYLCSVFKLGRPNSRSGVNDDIIARTGALDPCRWLDPPNFTKMEPLRPKPCQLLVSNRCGHKPGRCLMHTVIWSESSYSLHDDPGHQYGLPSDPIRRAKRHPTTDTDRADNLRR